MRKKGQTKRETYFVVVALLVIAGTGLFVISQVSDSSITGYVVADTQTLGDGKEESISQRQAFDAILRAEQDMRDMQEQGLGVQWVNDTLFEARKAFQGENYTALLIEAEKIEYSDKREFARQLLIQAQEALEGGQNIDVSYIGVLERTNAIKERKKQGFLLKDSLRVAELNILEIQDEGLDASEAGKILTDAQDEFDDERYTETAVLVGKVDDKLSEIRAEATFARTVYRAGKETAANFVRENWEKLAIAAAIILVIFLLFLNQIKIRILKSNIRNVKVEREVLNELIKRAQNDYYTKQNISKQTFDIKMLNYKERAIEIKRELPVMEDRLKKLYKGRRLI
jgi:hypothetical protein